MSSPSVSGRQQQPSNAPKTPTKLARKPGQTPQRTSGGKAPPKLGTSSTPQQAQKASSVSSGRRGGNGGGPSTPKAASIEQPEADEPQTPRAAQSSKAKKSATPHSRPSPRDLGKAREKVEQPADFPGSGNDYEDETTHDEDDDEPLSKVSQSGQDLSEAAPEPIKDDEEDEANAQQAGDATTGAQQQGRKAANRVEDAPDALEDDNDDNEGDDYDHVTAEQARQTGESAGDTTDDQDQGQQQTTEQQTRGGGLLSGAKNLAGKASGLAGRANGNANKASSAAGKATEDPRAAANDAKDGIEETASDVGETAKGSVDDAQDTASTTTDKTGKIAEKGADRARETADKASDEPSATVDRANEGADDAVDDVGQAAEDADVDQAAEDADGDYGVQETTGKAADAAKGATGEVEMPKNLPLDMSVLNGLEVDENGTVYDSSHNAIGRLTEGDAEDLAGYPIGDDGEIVDEDGDLVGRVELLPDEVKRQLRSVRDEGGELPEGADEYLDQLEDAGEDVEEDADEGITGNLPGLDILEGLTCQIDGLIYDADGNTIGRVTDGDPEQLQNATLNDQGEFIDDDGNVVGQADLHEEVQQLVEQGVYKPQEALNVDAADGEDVAEEGEALVQEGEGAAEDATDGIEDQLPGIEALQGKELNEAGQVLDDQGIPLADITDEDLKQKIADGEIDPNTLSIDEQGQIIDADGNVIGQTELAEGAAERLAGLLDFRILDGKRINKKGKILDDDGEMIGELTDGELADCTGQKANGKGEVLNKKGELVGHVRVVPGEAAQAATKELLEQLGELDGEANAEETTDALSLSMLEGLKVNKKGQVLNEDGEPIGELTSGDLKECAGKKINASGEVLDKDGNVIGNVQTLSQDSDAIDLSVLEGFKVNKKGQVLNEDGEPIGELTEGDLSQCTGKKINDQGEVLDASGNVIGKVQLMQPEQEEPEAQEEAQGEEAEQEDDQLPPLSILEGLTVNKAGNIIDANGTVVGQLVEGDPKKLSKSGITSDAEGQFWDNKGHVIGRATTVAVEDAEEEALFAGLEDLHVVEDGWVQDANGHTVGYITEGDPKKLIGRLVDEDGDIIDKKGSVVGHAERYEPEAEEEPQATDLSFLQGKTVSKSGLVMGDDGVPVARLIEGNPKELAGRKLDDQGQLWNDSGKVVGRVELIPEEEREQKPEGPFAGLEDLRVIQGGKVADEDGNVVGEIVEGNARRLVGLSVDEDGDIVDKYGNVKGRAEPLPDEEETDYSVLDGMTVNKQGNVVDSNGVPYGKLVDGNASELAGRQCDENGFIYNDTGKIVGRCEPLPEDERVARPEGPFAGLQGLRVAKGGKVVDEDGNEVGEITEGDPKRLVGLSVDEDGDIIDKFGNTKGHAEPLVEEEEEPVDNSILNNKTVNKQGYVVDEQGIPVGRLFEGNVSELAGRKCDENGYIYGDTGKVVGKCEVLPENERVARPEGPFAGLEGLRVVKDGFVEDLDGNRVGEIVEGNPKRLVGLHVDEDGDIIDKYGNVKGHAEPWEEEEQQATDLSALAGTVINKSGYAVDGNGTILGQVSEGNAKDMVGKKVDGEGQIWDDSGNIIGRCELVHGVGAPEGPFAGFDGLQIQKDGTITTPGGDIVGRVVEGDIKKLLGHTVDEDGDINDKNGNTIGKAERWEPEEKERRANPMSGRRVNKEGEVRDENGDLMGRLTMGDLGHCVGQEIDDAGNVVDVEGNKIGEVTLLENIAEDEYEGPSEEELAEAAKREEEREIAEKMGAICTQTLERMEPICKQITEHMERADRTPKEELDEEELVDKVKPLIEEGGRILQECNGSLRGLDPDGHIAAQAKGRAGTGEATPEEYRLAETLKELTTTVVTTIDNAKKKLNDMPHAKKKLNPLWALLTQPLFQILAAVGLLLAGVLGLVGQLLSALGLGGLVNGLLGGLGIDKLLSSLGLIDDPKKKKKGGSNPLGNIPVVGGLLGGKGK